MALLADALLVTAAVLVALTALPLYRAARGPTLYDRVVAINAVGTTTVVVLALLAAAFEVQGVIDVALVYAMLNFLVSIGVASLSDGGESGDAA